MARLSKSKGPMPGKLPPLPIDATEWQAIVLELGLSPQQAIVLDLILRSLSDKDIVTNMNIRPSTLRTYISRMFARTGTSSRIELAMRVLALCCRSRGKTPPDTR